MMSNTVTIDSLAFMPDPGKSFRNMRSQVANAAKNASSTLDNVAQGAMDFTARSRPVTWAKEKIAGMRYDANAAHENIAAILDGARYEGQSMRKLDTRLFALSNELSKIEAAYAGLNREKRATVRAALRSARESLNDNVTLQRYISGAKTTASGYHNSVKQAHELVDARLSALSSRLGAFESPSLARRGVAVGALMGALLAPSSASAGEWSRYKEQVVHSGVTSTLSDDFYSLRNELGSKPSKRSNFASLDWNKERKRIGAQRAELAFSAYDREMQQYGRVSPKTAEAVDTIANNYGGFFTTDQKREARRLYTLSAMNASTNPHLNGRAAEQGEIDRVAIQNRYFESDVGRAASDKGVTEVETEVDLGKYSPKITNSPELADVGANAANARMPNGFYERSDSVAARDNAETANHSLLTTNHTDPRSIFASGPHLAGEGYLGQEFSKGHVVSTTLRGIEAGVKMPFAMPHAIGNALENDMGRGGCTDATFKGIYGLIGVVPATASKIIRYVENLVMSPFK